MKKYLLGSVLLLSLGYAMFSGREYNVPDSIAQSKLQPHSINNFKGLRDSVPSILIEDNQAQDLLNVTLDDPRGVIRKRYGTEDYTIDTTSANWTTTYDADELPDSASPVWTKVSNASGSTEEIVDGKLHLETGGTTSDLYYHYSWAASTNTGYTIEARLKVINSQKDLDICIDFKDGAFKDVLYINNERIRLSYANVQYYMDTTDDYHTYRIVRNIGEAVTVYVDGRAQLSGTVIDTNSNNKISFGDMDTDDWGMEAYWDYVYVSTTAAYVPSIFTDTIYSAHNFDNGSNHYLLVQSSATDHGSGVDSIYITTDGAGTWTETITGLTNGNIASYADYTFGSNILCWGGNGADNEWYYDGSSTVEITTAPKGAVTASWLGRIWKSGISGVPSDVRWSDLTHGAHSGDGWGATQELEVGTSDPSAVMALVSDGSRLLVIKEDSTHAIYNTGGNTFNWVTISDEYGCIDKGSVKKYQGGHIWLSKTGFVFFDGTKFTIISEDITSTVNSLKQSYSYSNAKAWKIEKTEDFTASGSSESYVNTDSDKITLKIADWEQTDDDFNAGTTSNTVVSNGEIKLTVDSTSSTNSRSENLAHGRDVYGYWIMTGMCDGDSSTLGAQVVGNSTQDYNLAVLLDEATDINKVILKYKTGSGAYFANLKLQYKVAGGDWTDITGGDIATSASITTLTTTFTPISDVTDVSVYVSTKTSVASLPQMYIYELQVYETGYHTSGTFISQIHDTEITTPIWGDLSTIQEGGDTSYFVRTATATDGTWDTWRGCEENLQLTSDSERYIQWKASMTSTGDATPILKKVSLGYSRGENSGYYYTPRKDFGSDISGFDIFEVDMALNGQDIDFYVQTSSYATTPTSTSWIGVKTGAKPSNQALQYGWWKASLATDNSHDTPEIFSVKMNYYTGETAASQGSSAIYKRRYYYAGNTKESTYNDIVLVWDRFGNWSKYDWHVGAFAIYMDDLMYGDSNAKYVYQAEVPGVYSDDGESYVSFWKSKDFFFGSLANLKEYDKLYITHDYGDGNITFNYTQDIDGELTKLSIDRDDEAESKEINITKVNFSDGENSYFLNFEFRNEDTNSWRIFNLDLLYRVLGFDERSEYE